MSLLSVDIDIAAALQQLGATVGSLQAKINTNEILDAAGAALLNRTRTRYLREVDPDEVAWLPSKAALRRRLLGGTGTLFKTGTLFHSIQLHKLGPFDRAISTDVPYAKYNQPVRQFLGFSQDDEQVFSTIVTNMVNRALASA